MLKMAAVPTNSQISQHLHNAHFCDAFQISLTPCKRTALEIYLEVISKTPGWISFLMALRNRASPMFGIKNLEGIHQICANKKPNEYIAGDRIGIFTIHSITDDEVILADSDRHLDAKVSICKSLSGSDTTVTVSTVVHVHNLLGHIYMLFVTPFHKRIAAGGLDHSETRH